MLFEFDVICMCTGFGLVFFLSINSVYVCVHHLSVGNCLITSERARAQRSIIHASEYECSTCYIALLVLAMNSFATILAMNLWFFVLMNASSRKHREVGLNTHKNENSLPRMPITQNECISALNMYIRWKIHIKCSIFLALDSSHRQLHLKSNISQQEQEPENEFMKQSKWFSIAHIRFLYGKRCRHFKWRIIYMDKGKKTIIRTGHKCISVANGRFKLLNEYHFELKWMKESARSSEQAAARSFSFNDLVSWLQITCTLS